MRCMPFSCVQPAASRHPPGTDLPNPPPCPLLLPAVLQVDVKSPLFLPQLERAGFQSTNLSVWAIQVGGGRTRPARGGGGPGLTLTRLWHRPHVRSAPSSAQAPRCRRPPWHCPNRETPAGPFSCRALRSMHRVPHAPQGCAHRPVSLILPHPPLPPPRLPPQPISGRTPCGPTPKAACPTPQTSSPASPPPPLPLPTLPPLQGLDGHQLSPSSTHALLTEVANASAHSSLLMGELPGLGREVRWWRSRRARGFQCPLILAA